jgi:hypothetical protein
MSSTITTLAPTATILLIDDDESVRRITACIADSLACAEVSS